MKMKSNNIFSLAFVAIIGSLVIAQPAASAETTNHHGSICTTYQGTDKAKIYNASGGLYVDIATSVTCPLIRRTSNSNGAMVYVDVQLGEGTISCSLSSLSYDSHYLGSVNKSWTGVGFHEIILTLKDPGVSNGYSDYVVTCKVPARSYIRGIDLVEY